MSARKMFVLGGLSAVIAIFVVILLTGLAVWNAAHTDDASRVDHTDAIIVLGAAQYQGTPSPVFAGRLEQALNLYDQKRSDQIIVVGSSEPGDETTEAQSGADYLTGHGVPASAVHPVPVGSTTLESLKAAAGFMRSNGMRSAFLVSDPWHNLRIKRMASDLGIRGYASATWHSAATSEETRFSGYARETFAYLYYRIFGW